MSRVADFSHLDSIIFVHGFNETRDEAWMPKNGIEQWPQQFLRRSIDNARFLSFGYDATKNIHDLRDIVSEERIHVYANFLLTEIDKHRQGPEMVKFLPEALFVALSSVVPRSED